MKTSTPPDWFRSKASRLREIYRQRGLDGVKQSVLRLFRRPLRELAEFLWMLRLWREESQWNRLRGKNIDGHLEAIVDSGRILVHAWDPGVSRRLLLHGVHEPIASELVKGLLQDGMFVVDIGSNIGYYVLLEARLVGKRGRVVAIEPVPRNTNLLKKNIALNALKNVRVIEGAIGEQNGPGIIYLSERSNWHSMFPSHQTQLGTMEVEVYRLDSLVERLMLPRIDLIRMDLEGYEVFIIKGMIHTLEKYRPRLVIELHPPLVGGRRIVDLLAMLKEIGYESKYVIHRALEHYPSWMLHGNWSQWQSLSIDEMINDPRIVNAETWFTGFFEPVEGEKGGKT